MNLFLNNGINDSDSSKVHNFMYRTFRICEMNRFIKSHLDRTYEFHMFPHTLKYLTTTIGRTQIREYQRVHLLSLEARKWILLVTQLIVKCKINLHFSVNIHIGIFLLKALHYLVHHGRRTRFVTTKIRI